MRVLLIGQADSIFFENYTKTIKKLRPDLNFDVFSIDEITEKYDLSACDEVFVNSWMNSRLRKLKGIRAIISPIYTWISLYFFIKSKKENYDIIHFKWLVPGVVLFNLQKMHCIKKSVATFWGGELEGQKIFYSKGLYRFVLKRFLKRIDSITYSTEEEFNNISRIGVAESKLKSAIYGSTIYKGIETITENETKQISKKYWNINSSKITISLGYSGKEVHQHIPIIETLFNSETFIERIEDFIFILPFTHGGTAAYYSNIVKRLDRMNAKYILISKRMTDLEVARLRNATDIMLQLSVSDKRSASIIEIFLAGSILISGKWLPYQVFRKKNLHFYELDSIDSTLPKMILNIAENIQDELKKCVKNKTKWGFETWEKVTPNWINIYDKVLSNVN